MRPPPTRYLALGFTLVALLGGCDRQGEGEACSTQGDDCQSPLTCVPILAGYTVSVGKCCMPNTQCGSAPSGFMLNQDSGDEGSDASVGALDETRDTDASPANDAVGSDGGGG